MIELVGYLRKISFDLHAAKGNLAANSSLTQGTYDMQLELQERQAATDKKLDDLVVKNEEMLAVFNAGKKGVNFLQSLGRGVSATARWFLRWVLPVMAAGSILWGLFHGQWPGPPGSHE